MQGLRNFPIFGGRCAFCCTYKSLKSVTISCFLGGACNITIGLCICTRVCVRFYAEFGRFGVHFLFKIGDNFLFFCCVRLYMWFALYCTCFPGRRRAFGSCAFACMRARSFVFIGLKWCRIIYVM